VQVPLTQEQVVIARDLDLVAVVGAEQHPVTGLDGADVVADCQYLAPDEPLGHLRGGWDDDAAR